MKRAIMLTWALGAAALCGVFGIVRASEITTMVGTMNPRQSCRNGSDRVRQSGH
jgi:hypothetical protein